MAIESHLKILTVSGIDGTATGSTLIQTTDAGLRFVPLFVNVEPTTVTTFISVPSFSIGTNGATYNNILTITAMTGLTAANIMLQNNVLALASSIAASTGIYINITTGAVSAAYTMRATVLGFYY